MSALRIAYGPALWFLHFGAVYGFTALACARGFPHAVPWAIGVLTLVLGAASAFVILTPKKDFVGWLTAALGAFALAAILLQTLPAFLVSPCA